MESDGQEPPKPHVIEVPSIESTTVVYSPRLIAKVPLDWLVEGFGRAKTRFEEAADLDSPIPAHGRATFIPLFEALNWAATVTLYLRETGKTTTPMMRGVNYARNRVHHSWADAVEPHYVEVEHAVGPVAISDKSFDDWYWRSVENLPDPSLGNEDPDGRADYVQLLQGRRASEALGEISGDLARETGG